MFQINSMRIRELVFERGLSIAAFAKQSGLTEITARKVINDGAKVSMKTLGTLAKFFGTTGENLILKE